MEKDNLKNEDSFINKTLTKYKKHTIGIVIIIALILLIYYNYEGYVNSPPGLSKLEQIRSDSTFDKKWNLDMFEKSVSYLNSKTN